MVHVRARDRATFGVRAVVRIGLRLELEASGEWLIIKGGVHLLVRVRRGALSWPYDLLCAAASSPLSGAP